MAEAGKSDSAHVNGDAPPAGPPGGTATPPASGTAKPAESDSTDDPARAYLRQVGSFPRLTPSEEVFYAKQYANARDAVRVSLSSWPGLVVETLEELLAGQATNRLAQYIDPRPFES
ncbi:MAG: hypothetical protein HON70_37945, partial [Lentisphaerae bacterium]|nr:hypothetical protein [Lentisphaerota bacterium]